MGSADLDAKMTSIGPVEEDAGWSPAATEQDGSRGPIGATDATAAAAPTRAGQSAAFTDAPGGLPAGLTASTHKPVYTPVLFSAHTTWPLGMPAIQIKSRHLFHAHTCWACSELQV